MSAKDANVMRTADIMVCAMARLLRDGDIAFSGLASHIPVTAIGVARAVHAPGIWQLNTSGGVCGKHPLMSSYTTIGNSMRNASVGDFPLDEVFDLSMRGRLDVAFMGGVQFDATGGINSSVIGDYNRPKVRLPGGAGSVVIVPTAKRVVAWRPKHDVRTFVEKLDFVTSRGNVDAIVTNMAVLRMRNGRLALQSYHPGFSVQEVKENTGFMLDCTGAVQTPEPSPAEKAALQRVDPKGYRYLEF